MGNGGEVANRGFIFQAIVALIECLDPKNDWDEIKNEPDTDEDKVDIMLYKDGRTLSAIQVKSSINPFQRADAKKWLEALRNDAKDAERIFLCLVGDSFTPSCEEFIEANSEEIKTVPYKHLQSVSTIKLIEYINRIGLGDKVRLSDLELIDASLFSKILKNSVAKEPIKRVDFEAQFKSAIPKGEELAEWIVAAVSGLVQKDSAIPQSLTPVPPINKKVGLVGRDDIVQKAKDKLEAGDYTALVSGLGGIGKTAVMQLVCNDLFNNEKYVAWFKWEESLKNGLLLLRYALHIPAEVPADEAYTQVVNVIKTQLPGKLYLFIDDLSRKLNADERKELRGLRAHVMVTARFEDDYFESLPLAVLEKEAVIEMFYRYYGGDEERRYEATAWSIIESVSSHTLLVELLAKAAKEEGGTLDDFYAKLKKEGFFDVSEEELVTEHDDENLTIEDSVIRLYKISGLTEEQQRIMKLFTIFSHEKEIYYKVREWAGFDRKELKKLVELGWLERGGLETGYQIHQIVKDSIARQMKKNGEEVKLEEYGDFLDKVIATDDYLGREVTYDKVRERLVLTEDVARFIADSGREDADTGTLFHNMADVYESQGDYDKALEYNGKALAIRERVLGPDHPDTATTYSNMALVYLDQGDYEKALEYYGKALAICERVLGRDHPDTATTYNCMAGVYYAQGDYEKALEYNGKALSIRERVLGRDHPDTATTYNNMAGVYYAQGEYEKALEYYGKALAIVEYVLGPDHPNTASTYNNMAGVYYAQGDYEKALEYNGKALSIRERVLGTDHPSTATTYNNTASVYSEQGDYEKALEYYGKALTIVERVLGTDHPSTATTYNNMAWNYRDQGDFKTALYYYKKAYDIRLKKLGENHPKTKSTKRSIEIMESKLK